MAIGILGQKKTSSSSTRKLGAKNVLTPEGESILSQEEFQTINEDRQLNLIGGNTTNTSIENKTLNYTDSNGRTISDIYSGDQTAIKKNLEKRKSLLSQGIGAGKSLLGGAVI